jgi:hypothetical protein
LCFYTSKIAATHSASVVVVVIIALVASVATAAAATTARAFFKVFGQGFLRVNVDAINGVVFFNYR